CSVLFVFFFQAEDGIRDFHVTGVQTCALPISAASTPRRRNGARHRCTAKTAATAQATAGRSQLWKAYSTSGGLSAHSAARHPLNRPSHHVTANPNGASSSAEAAKNPASVSTNIAPSHISSPVSTGYSTTPP